MLLAVSQELGLRVEDDVARGIAYGFAGGIGSTGSVCGAVVGGVMALGLKLGRDETTAEGLAKFAVAREFRRRFEDELSSIICRELTGTDLTLHDEAIQFMTSDKPQRVCFPAVGTAYEIVMELMKETSA